MDTIRRLARDRAGARWRAGLSILLGAVAVCFGVALMATAGYLISRAAEQPPILSLTVTIVAVRFFGLARPLARYLDRLVGHDLALRALSRIRAGFYERIEPLAPAQLEGYRRGDLLARMVNDVDALQGLYLRGLGPPLVALVVGAACVGFAAAVLPAAGVVVAAGLVVAEPSCRRWPVRSGGARVVARPLPGRADRRAGRVAVRRSRAGRVRSGGEDTRTNPVARPRAGAALAGMRSWPGSPTPS